MYKRKAVGIATKEEVNNKNQKAKQARRKREREMKERERRIARMEKRREALRAQN